jgi:hypothetical protein
MHFPKYVSGTTVVPQRLAVVSFGGCSGSQARGITDAFHIGQGEDGKAFAKIEAAVHKDLLAMREKEMKAARYMYPYPFFLSMVAFLHERTNAQRPSRNATIALAFARTRSEVKSIETGLNLIAVL